MTCPKCLAHTSYYCSRPNHCALDPLAGRPASKMLLKAIDQALARSGMTRQDLARKLGVTPPRVTDMLDPRNGMNMRTVDRIFKAIGYQHLPRFEVEPFL